jgi:uncharacterized protein (TIGR02284 family)
MSFVRTQIAYSFYLPTKLIINQAKSLSLAAARSLLYGSPSLHCKFENRSRGRIIMAVTSGDIASTLNNLIQTCKDGSDGFREAAKGVQDDELRDLFTRYSQQRAQFATELQDEVTKLGDSPETSGSLAASLHRGWINIREAITGNSEAAVLDECERGEDIAVDAYQDALKQSLPADVQSVVQRQYMQVKEAHDRVRSLRNMSNAAAS